MQFSNNGEIEWVRTVGGIGTDRIQSVCATSEEGYILAGKFWSEVIQIGEYTITNSDSSIDLIIKCNKFGEIEWSNKKASSV